MDLNENKLFQKDFTLVVIGQIISLFGNAILRFSLPLYLLRETGSAAIIIIFYLLLGKVPTIPLFILVLMLLDGISGIYQPAVQASIPLLVPSQKLMSGNAVINQVGTYLIY